MEWRDSFGLREELPVQVELSSGSRLGPFELVRRLGCGSSSEVWLARKCCGCEVAVKFVRPGQRACEQVLGLVSNERRIGRRLGPHRRLATATAWGLLPAGAGEGGAWLSMPFHPAALPMNRWLRKLRATPAATKLLALVFSRTAEAMHYVHGRNVIHRDLKPQNVLIGPDHEPIVADFGLAYVPGSDGHARGVVGTPGFMSPEHHEGRAEELGDQYSLGCMLLRALEALRPSRAANALRSLGERAKAEVPAARFVSMASFADALRHAS